jgi:UPF0755 protein
LVVQTALWHFVSSSYLAASIMSAQRNHSGRALWTWLCLIFLLALMCVVAGITYVHYRIHLPISPDQSIFVVPPGQSFNGFARDLKQTGLVDETYSLRAWAWWTKQSTQIKAGQYRLDEQQSLAAILDHVVSGKVVLFGVQFIEGWTFTQMRLALAEHPDLVKETTELTEAEILSLIAPTESHPEGLFFPDTYRFPQGTSDLEILRQAYAAMAKMLEKQWQARDSSTPLKTPYEALILASIIEKETGQGGERREISGVFTNRLNLNMRLQTDPTVIYGMGDKYKGNIKRKHLREDTPYNTYTRHGLPPTPIAMPGKASIFAALHPAQTDALYFVAKGEGSHYFSITLKEHNAAVRKYQLKRKTN